MATWLLPTLFALCLWWSSTLLVLYLNGLTREAARRSFAIGTVVAAAAAVALVATVDDGSVGGAYLAFACGLILWGWHELSYYAGVITGPGCRPCPAEAGGWERFGRGVRTSIHHELAVVATAGLLALVVAGAPNQIGLWTFVILWLMRWSAKLNIFLGVRNLHEEFWPDRLRYLSSYARRRRMNALFPASMVISSLVLARLLTAAPGTGDDPAGTVGLVLLATLLALAILEHVLLMLPCSDERLWELAMRSRRGRSPGRPPVARPEPLETG